MNSSSLLYKFNLKIDTKRIILYYIYIWKIVDMFNSMALNRKRYSKFGQAFPNNRYYPAFFKVYLSLRY